MRPETRLRCAAKFARRSDLSHPSRSPGAGRRNHKKNSYELIVRAKDDACMNGFLLSEESNAATRCVISIGNQNKPETNNRSEEHTSELQSHSFISYAVFC